ncbi:DUF4426 domain-containing protein [Psychrosphaera sp.]|nr:DUF4426 domain-containing protein [Psychrosphaera sp.]
MKKILFVIATLVSALFLSPTTLAEQKITKGDWDIHYIAFPSSFIKPETARNYNLERSRYMAIVNISVLDKESQQAQNVSLTGTAKNLLGQTKQLTFKKVQEKEAIYYLAQLKHRDEENLTFTVNVQRGNRTETIKFKKKLYVD